MPGRAVKSPPGQRRPRSVPLWTGKMAGRRRGRSSGFPNSGCRERASATLSSGTTPLASHKEAAATLRERAFVSPTGMGVGCMDHFSSPNGF